MHCILERNYTLNTVKVVVMAETVTELEEYIDNMPNIEWNLAHTGAHILGDEHIFLKITDNIPVLNQSLAIAIE